MEIDSEDKSNIEDGWAVVHGVKRGECTECDCNGYQGSKGPCSSCGHFPAKHKFMGKSKFQEEVTPQQSFQETGLVGTPFSEKDIERKKNVPMWEQVVKDEKGKRKFHGAFTGGFTAGFGNTVGSKEGWAPSQWSSSRSQRGTNVTQSALDFQDQEDINTELLSGQALTAKSEYNTFGGTQMELSNRKRTGNDIFDSLIVPTNDSIGVRLLRKMGWREHHKLGFSLFKPKLAPSSTSIATSASVSISPSMSASTTSVPSTGFQAKRTYGPALPKQLAIQESQVEGEDENGDDMTVDVPKDVTEFKFSFKEDAHGLGFQPMLENPMLQEMTQSRDLAGKPDKSSVMKMSDILTGKVSSSKFGLSALEEADDEEIYSSETMDMYHTTLTLEEEEAASARKAIPKKSTLGSAASSVKEYATDSKRCSDGSLPLRGFRISTASHEVPKWFAAPDVPKDWQPKHKHNMPSPLEITGTGSGTLTARDRGVLLGETPLPFFSQVQSQSQPQSQRTTGAGTQAQESPRTGSVFNFISPEDRNRLAILTNKFSSAGVEQHPSLKAGVSTVTSIPVSSAPIPTPTSTPASQAPQQMQSEEEEREKTEWELIRERDKKIFEESAVRFKPLSDLMGSRFTKPIIENPSVTIDYSTSSKPNDNLSSQTKSGFVKITRQVEEFFPVPLLCKRFGFKSPHVGKKAMSKKPVNELLSGPEMSAANFPLSFTASEIEMQNKDSMARDDNSPLTSRSATEPSSTSVDQFVQINAEGESSEEELPAVEKPSMDLFKAIFEDSDEESQPKSQPLVLSPASPSAKSADAASINLEAIVEPDDINSIESGDGNGSKNENGTLNSESLKTLLSTSPSTSSLSTSIPQAISTSNSDTPWTSHAPRSLSKQEEVRMDAANMKNMKIAPNLPNTSTIDNNLSLAPNTLPLLPDDKDKKSKEREKHKHKHKHKDKDKDKKKEKKDKKHKKEKKHKS